MNLPSWLLVLPMIAQPQPLAPVPLGNAEAWALLPGATAAPKPLPSWARMLAKSMPRATAGMLRLDALTRTTPSPLAWISPASAPTRAVAWVRR